jgi:putative phage-type endonuclease
MDMQFSPLCVLDRLLDLEDHGLLVGDRVVPGGLSQLASWLTGAAVSPQDLSLLAERRRHEAEAVLRLRQLPVVEQRSPEWHAMRTELITASDAAQALGKGKFGSARELIVKKVDPSLAPPFPEAALVWGTRYEPVAKQLYALRMGGVTVHEFGLLRHPRLAFVGASPDGITDSGVMVELKAPFRRVITGDICEQYIYQIQSQLDVCGLTRCDYAEFSFAEYPGGVAEFLADGGEGPLRADGRREKGAMSRPARMASAPGSVDPGGWEYHFDAVQIREAMAAASTDVQVLFWKLEVANIVRVARNDAFIAAMNARLATFWEKVLRYRADREAFVRDMLPASSRAAASAVPLAELDALVPASSDEDS